VFGERIRDTAATGQARAMNRRQFLRATAAAVGAITLDPELALWVPGRKTIFIPNPAPPKIIQVAFDYDSLLSKVLIDYHKIIIKNITEVNSLLMVE
jgi:hypothetical protein